LIGDDANGISQRVRQLACLATLDNVSSGGRLFDSKAWPWACFAAILISAILSMTSPSTLLAVHDMIELVVSKLHSHVRKGLRLMIEDRNLRSIFNLTPGLRRRLMFAAPPAQRLAG